MRGLEPPRTCIHTDLNRARRCQMCPPASRSSILWFSRRRRTHRPMRRLPECCHVQATPATLLASAAGKLARPSAAYGRRRWVQQGPDRPVCAVCWTNWRGLEGWMFSTCSHGSGVFTRAVWLAARVLFRVKFNRLLKAPKGDQRDDGCPTLHRGRRDATRRASGRVASGAAATRL